MKTLSRRLRELQDDPRQLNYNNNADIQDLRWKHVISSIIIDVTELENLIACCVDPTGLSDREQEICRQCLEQLDEER